MAGKGRDWGWGSGLTIGLLALTALSLVGFVPWERRMAEEAILPLRIFTSSVFSLSSVIALLVGAAMFGGLVVLPLYLQIVRGESPTGAGLKLIPLMVGIIVTSAFSGRYMSRTGRYKCLPVAGTALMFAALLLMSTLGVDTPLWQAMAFMVVMGAGLGLSMQTLVISVQNALPPGAMGWPATSRSAHVPRPARRRRRALRAGLRPRRHDSHRDAARSLPPGVLEGFAQSMSTVFLVVAVLLIPASC